MARPRKEINFEEFEKLVAMQNTVEDIAFFFGVSADTIERRCVEHYCCSFAETRDRYSSKGRMKLIHLLWKHAENNPNTAHFLAKNWLKMQDAPVQINNTNVNKVESHHSSSNIDFGAEQPASEELSEKYRQLFGSV